MAWIFAPPQEGAPLAGPARLLVLYFLSLAYGAVDILLFAFLLRRVMRLWGTHNIAIWMVAGAALGAVLVKFLLWSGDALTNMSPLSAHGPISYLLLALWTAPNALRLAASGRLPWEARSRPLCCAWWTAHSTAPRRNRRQPVPGVTGAAHT